MRKLLIIGLLLFTAIFLAGAQQGSAYQNVTSSPDGGCLQCHPTAAGTGLHTVSAHTSCASCHAGGVPGKNVVSAKCIVCHPRTGGTGQCPLVNLASHPKSGVQACLTCHATCTPAACIDADNDTYGANCTAGPDCNDTDPTIHTDCSCIDNDNDTYGDNCTAGPDCDDTDPTIHTGCCVDNDGDGYGDNCTLGPDCDDTDNTTHDNCEIDCTLQVTPKTFSPIRALLQPFEFFTIRADRDSSISFANPICIFWESEGIDDVIKLRIGEKLIIGYVRVWASHLTAGDFKVMVTFGDTSETQCGPITVNGNGASSFIQSSGVKLQNNCGK